MIPQQALSLLTSQSTIASLSMIFRLKDDGISCSLVPTMGKVRVATKVGSAEAKPAKIQSFVFTGSASEVEADIRLALEGQLVASIEKSEAVSAAQLRAKVAEETAVKAEAAAKKRTAEAQKLGKVADPKEMEALKAQVEKLEAAAMEKDAQIAGLREPDMFAAAV